jgi:hypothetical protein
MERLLRLTGAEWSNGSAPVALLTSNQCGIYDVGLLPPILLISYFLHIFITKERTASLWPIQPLPLKPRRKSGITGK